jgi:tetratricopeptide (TPR) repeat protein
MPPRYISPSTWAKFLGSWRPVVFFESLDERAQDASGIPRSSWRCSSAADKHHCDARAVSLSNVFQNRRLDGLILGSLASLRHEQGRDREARELYEKALHVLQEVGDQRSEGITQGRLAALRALAGNERNEEVAEQALKQAKALLKETELAIFVELARSFVDLAGYQKDPLATRHRDAVRAVRARIRQGDPSPLKQWDDIRLLDRILERKLAEIERTPAAAP